MISKIISSVLLVVIYLIIVVVSAAFTAILCDAKGTSAAIPMGIFGVVVFYYNMTIFFYIRGTFTGKK